jgi:hypothetical protein
MFAAAKVAFSKCVLRIKLFAEARTFSGAGDLRKQSIFSSIELLTAKYY